MKVRDKNVLIEVMDFRIQKGKTLVSNWARSNSCPTKFYSML